ncbi:hypothetical protein [Legionella quinlivanii]|uniref:hypothetical protein n=1 Tax=Legionella quinlivanii TaxID=45073 RepID=UPI0022440CA2|nr:hypothetical protein [Legionella quinlivanii]MCW8452594.1 hypothetical protein [Legionella quinlivanii]
MSLLIQFFILLFLFPSLGMTHSVIDSKVEKLLARHIEASGGENALLTMQSISRYGQITFFRESYPKESYCYHTDIVYPGKLREQIKGRQIEYDRGTDGTSYWLWTGNQYEFTDNKALIDYMKNTAERANRDLLWVRKESGKFTLPPSTPSWAPENSECIQAREGKPKRAYCFDSSTGLLNAIGSQEEYRLQSDWRTVGNLKIPFHLVHYQNGAMVYELQLDHAKLNDVILEIQFHKPVFPHLDC